MADRVDEDRVLDGARRALERHGPQKATLERIAEEAGVSRVTLHRRGITRESILSSLADRAAEGYRAALWPALTAQGSARERLEAALVALCEVAEANLALLLALQGAQDAVFHTEAGGEVTTRAPFTEPLRRLLLDGAADGTLAAGAVDVDDVATLLFNQVGWTYVHLRTGHRWDPSRARTRVVALALDGVAARPA